MAGFTGTGTSTIDRELSVVGNRRRRTGTFTFTSVQNTVAIDTGLRTITAAGAEQDSHFQAFAVKVTKSAGTLTIAGEPGISGTWFAEGI